MTPIDVLVKALTDAGIAYSNNINSREAAALRAALVPWIAWIRRPEFAAPDATYDVFVGGPKSGTVEHVRGDVVLGILGPDGRDSGWTQVGDVLVEPLGFDGEPPRWVYDMMEREELTLRTRNAHRSTESTVRHGRATP